MTFFLPAGRGTRVLAKRAIRKMRRVHFPDLDDTQGLVWYYDRFGRRRRVLGHTGSDPGTSSMMFFDPREGTGVLLVANGSWKWSRANRLVRRLFKEAKKGW